VAIYSDIALINNMHNSQFL